MHERNRDNMWKLSFEERINVTACINESRKTSITFGKGFIIISTIAGILLKSEDVYFFPGKILAR